MRVIPSLLLILCLAACQRGGQNNADAVRQGVIDHLAKANYNVPGMDIKISDVKYNGDQADATVAVTAKGQSGAPPMTLRYHLLHQNNQWVVQGMVQDPGGAGSNPHGGSMPTPADGGAANPHGGGMPPANGAGQMPSPHDLPPATKK